MFSCRLVSQKVGILVTLEESFSLLLWNTTTVSLSFESLFCHLDILLMLVSITSFFLTFLGKCHHSDTTCWVEIIQFCFSSSCVRRFALKIKITNF
ncbi:hypothetical protein HanIR_Chr09g0397801 [Helianthus annuus]|nr:hypothetical protein HanIR_Chr09g0397801 [Helianthus annuus]